MRLMVDRHRTERDAVSGDSRTRRASLTFLSTMLQQGAEMLVTFVVTPIVVRGLGAELYGAWMVIQQVGAYLGLGDLHSSSALKLKLAISQHMNDVGAKRRQIGATIVIWLCMLPLLGAAGGILVAVTPSLVSVSPDHGLQVQLGMALVVLNVCLAGLLSIPPNILRGMNLDYKAMELNALIIGVTGALNTLAIKLGMGLPGLAASTIVGAVTAALVRLYVARRVLPWLGVERPLLREIGELFGVSWWLLGSNLAYLSLNSSDFILAGMLLGGREAGIYAATGLVLRMASGPVAKLLDSGSPGIADLWGRGDIQRIANVRTTMQIFAIFVTTILGVGVVVLNEAFLKLWMGAGFYAGGLVNVLLVLLAIQSLATRMDILLMDCMLKLRLKTLMMAIGGVIGIGLALLLTRRMGLVGLALGILIGRSILTMSLLPFVSRRLGLSMTSYLGELLRPLFMSACLLLAGYLVSSEIGRTNTWLGLSMRASLLGVSVAMLLWTLGLTAHRRDQLLRFARSGISSII